MMRQLDRGFSWLQVLYILRYFLNELGEEWFEWVFFVHVAFWFRWDILSLEWSDAWCWLGHVCDLRAHCLSKHLRGVQFGHFNDLGLQSCDPLKLGWLCQVRPYLLVVGVLLQKTMFGRWKLDCVFARVRGLNWVTEGVVVFHNLN